MMMIIMRICYDKKWQEWCTIDEDDTMNEDFNNNEAFENEDNNNKCNDRWMNEIFQIKCNADVNKISMCFLMIFSSSISQFSAIVDIYSAFF